MPEILNMLYLTSVFFAILTITMKNPVISVLFLIGLFINVAIYLIFMGINFIALSYLLVYVGAVSILFIFILMLINIRTSELSYYTNNSLPLGFIIIVVFIACIYQLLNLDTKSLMDKNYLKVFNYDYINTGLYNFKVNGTIHYVTAANWDNKVTEIDNISSIGNVIYTNYSIWLILTSLILLLAMVGAIIITIGKKH